MLLFGGYLAEMLKADKDGGWDGSVPKILVQLMEAFVAADGAREVA